MAYHDELLAQAEKLLQGDEKDLTQADLRRAVSTAYYAMFHLLIDETTLNWNRDSSRHTLGRMFEHGLMRRVSQRLVDTRAFAFPGADPVVLQKLKDVAKAFVNLQDSRHLADYHNGVIWNHIESLDEVSAAKDAFAIWATIRHEDIAQDYLVSLLIKPRD
ncbi:MAG: hypothetical protein FJW38_14515 [Acidobacteria bacterium]|nr:hypothetical protein [Acidobacteriota bacterium]